MPTPVEISDTLGAVVQRISVDSASNRNGGTHYVRSTDPGTSHRAVPKVIASLPMRQRQCCEMVGQIGRPCTRNEIRAQAQAAGFAPDVAETIRRRATDLLDGGVLYVVSGDGDSEVLWFDDEVDYSGVTQ